MQIRRRGVLAAFIAVLMVAGCGDSSPPSAAADSPSTSPSASPLSPGGASAAGKPESISGKLVAGVEPNCLLLQGTGKRHLLIFADPSIKRKAKVGQSVTVVGTARPGQMTTCQQGTPFFVTALSPGLLGA